MMRFYPAGHWVAMGLLLMGAGCAHHQQPQIRPAVISTTAPTTCPVALAQPPLRLALEYLAVKGIEDAGEAPVFMLSHWLMQDKGQREDDPDRRKFEGAPFHCGDAVVFLAVGPVHDWLKKPKPPGRDLLVPWPPDQEGKIPGVTVMLAGQDWNLGYSIKKGNPELEKRLTDSLVEFAKAYRAKVLAN